MSNKSIICWSSNLYFKCFAGFPPTTEYGSTSFVTKEPAATIDPCPMLTPDIIVDLAPIQTSFPIVISPLQDGCPISMCISAISLVTGPRS